MAGEDDGLIVSLKRAPAEQRKRREDDLAGEAKLGFQMGVAGEKIRQVASKHERRQAKLGSQHCNQGGCASQQA